MSDSILSASAPQSSSPAPTPPAASEADARRAAWPNSPALWNEPAKPRAVDPAVAAAFPNSPGMLGATPPVAATPPPAAQPTPSTPAPAVPAPTPTVADLWPASPSMHEAAPSAKDLSAPTSTATAAPEGFDAADPAYQEFQAIATEARLPAEAAAKVLALHTKALDSHRQQFRALVAQWGEESKADPEIGGARYAENVTLARGMLERFGDAELRDVLGRSGLGNHRAVIRLLVRVAQNR